MSDEMTRIAIVVLFGTLSVLVLGVLVPRFLSQRRMRRERRDLETVYEREVTTTVTVEVFDDDEEEVIAPFGRPGSHRAKLPTPGPRPVNTRRKGPPRRSGRRTGHLRVVDDNDNKEGSE